MTIFLANASVPTKDPQATSEIQVLRPVLPEPQWARKCPWSWRACCKQAVPPPAHNLLKPFSLRCQKAAIVIQELGSLLDIGANLKSSSKQEALLKLFSSQSGFERTELASKYNHAFVCWRSQTLFMPSSHKTGSCWRTFNWALVCPACTWKEQQLFTYWTSHSARAQERIQVLNTALAVIYGSQTHSCIRKTGVLWAYLLQLRCGAEARQFVRRDLEILDQHYVISLLEWSKVWNLFCESTLF